MAYSEDHIALAAEYALGTLDSDERTQVETMMTVDHEFAGVVQAWEFRLGPLNQMVGLVEPRPVNRRRRWCCPNHRPRRSRLHQHRRRSRWPKCGRRRSSTTTMSSSSRAA
jgi:anti-sigma-K factor RskA